jgi:aspartate/methionine/tyrosine aminotransferase
VSLTPGERGWTLDLDKLFAACDGRTRAILVNSPGNPTGWLASADDIGAMLAFCRKRRIWLIADEVYERIVYDRKVAPSPLDLAGPDDPVISVNSFSKSWCMTGWRLGWLVTPPALGEQLGKINEFNVSCAPAFVQAGGIAAVTQGESFVAELVQQYSRARDMVIQRLQSLPRVRFTRPDAAFYAFFQVDGVADSLALARRIVANTNVGLAPGVASAPRGRAGCASASPSACPSSPTPSTSWPESSHSRAIAGATRADRSGAPSRIADSACRRRLRRAAG